ncbi:hypothetical protein [Mesorhizobium sp. BR1-1-14]|uniref:hypothetical protein n=1 Tax=Mesorhizobium sp. BR1-1-14 TaxID=2876655 RepID=UPI001CD1220C|nr:hypothetical protein [Mesorhizobium sp. BR1-1-14]MBZ9959338.1 hypothetical protein [Mesorhizobium sp. BR1-1-14]
MTRDEAKAAPLHQIEGMPPEMLETARNFTDLMDDCDRDPEYDDADYVQTTNTIIAALKFVEFCATGVRPKTSTVQ